MGSGRVGTALAALRAGYEELAACDLEALSRSEQLEVLDELETLACQLPTPWHRLLTELQTQTTPRELGAKSWPDVLAIRWRLSRTEARRRLADAAELGPRRTLTGQPLTPLLTATATAQASGAITGAHVATIRDTMNRLPPAVDALTREQLESDLVALATGVGPKELTDAAAKVLFLLDQDGPAPDDAERARRRGLHVGKQGPDGMIPIRGLLTPEAWACYEAIFAKWAAPGMCHPDDPAPCLSGTPSQQQLDTDHRSLGQRQHDALIAIARNTLESGQLGQHNGLPTSVIIRTTLQDLESRAGVGITGGGTMIPIGEVIRMAAHANHYLAVFDRATGSALELFRTKRIASPAQRVMLIARDGGCTKPCCTVPAYGSQVHHATQDWNAGGNTNVDDLALACGPDNRLVDTNGWTTTINSRGHVEWTPPPHLDHGQTRINHYHLPDHPPNAPPDGGHPVTESDPGGAERPTETPPDGGHPATESDPDPPETTDAA